MVHLKKEALLFLTLVPPFCVESFSPQRAPSRFRSTEINSLKKNDEKFIGGVAGFFTGLVIATQVAFADPSMLTENSYKQDFATNPITQNESMESSSFVVSAFGAPGGASSGSSSFDTLDFSLPSYTEATKSPVMSSTKTEAPPSTSKEQDEEAAAAAKKAAEEEKAVAKKAAEEEKIAAKKAAEEEKIAAKKAEEEKAAKLKEKEEAKAARVEAQKKMME